MRRLLMKAHGFTLASLSSVLALSFFLVACGSSQARPGYAALGAGDPCYDVTTTGRRVLSAEARSQVQATVMEWGDHVGTDVAEREAHEMTSTMERLAAAWSRIRAAVCRDRLRQRSFNDRTYRAGADRLASPGAHPLAEASGEMGGADGPS